MMAIPLMSPNITEDDIAAVADVLRSGMLVQGPNVERLERAVAEYIGVPHVVAVSSGTAGLHLALMAMGIGPGDEVIVPAYSFPATANAVELVGATPVFVDIDDATFNIDVSQIESVLTPRTKAILPVHEFGLACDITEIVALAAEHGIFVIEDAACALGSAENGGFAGSLGSIGVFSLHPRKAITSGEGGLLATADDAIAGKLRSLRNHGIEAIDGRADFTSVGLNYRLTDFQAALALSQFARFEPNLARKGELAAIYSTKLGGETKIKLSAQPDGKRHAWQTYQVLLDDKLDRDMVISKLADAGIGSNYGAQCIPDLAFYQERYALDCERHFPNAMRAWRQGLALPIYEKLSDKDVAFVADSLCKILNELDQ